MNAHKPYQPVVARLLAALEPRAVLDAPCGSGWLRALLRADCALDGLDLFAARPAGYRDFRACDLGDGLPGDLASYDAVVSCEGIEHFGNPDRFFSTAFERLVPGGMLIVTTPNTWYPAARLQYLLRGFFPSFPSLAGCIQPGTHMHIMPWSYPQLFLYLRRNGFVEVALHDVDEPRPKHHYERLLGQPQKLYCKRRARRASSDEEREFWIAAGSVQSRYGRRLVVSARRPAT